MNNYDYGKAMARMLLADDEWGTEYVYLMLQLDDFDPEQELTVDSCSHPLAAELRARKPHLTIPQIIERLKALRGQMSVATQRERCLAGRINGAMIRAKVLAGTSLSLTRQFTAIHRIPLEMEDDASSREAVVQIADIIPARIQGDIVPGRLNAWRDEFRVPQLVHDLGLAERIFRLIIQEVRGRAEVVWGASILPPEEGLRLKFERDRPIGGEHKERGRGISDVSFVFQTACPPLLAGYLDTAAHELYPGHATLGWNWERLAWQNGLGELLLMASYSPELLPVEGSAELALNMLWPNIAEQAEFMAGMYKIAGMGVDLGELKALMGLRELDPAFLPAAINSGLMVNRALEQGRKWEELAEWLEKPEIDAYLVDVCLHEPRLLPKFYGFLQKFGCYWWAYKVGRRICAAWLAQQGDFAAQQRAFVRLLTEQMFYSEMEGI